MELQSTRPSFLHFFIPPAARRRSTQTTAMIAGEFLESCRGRAKRSTCSTYATVIERHICPEFGSRPICGITREDVNSYLYRASFGDDGLSVASVRVIVSVLRALFRYAESLGLPVISPDCICRPSGSGAEARVLSLGEQQRLREHLCRDADSVKLGVLICLYTGLRIGEICAMKWGDINFESGTLSVRRTVQRIKNLDYREGSGEGRTKVIFDAPKSRASARCIPIPGFLLELMRQHRCSSDCFILTGDAERFLEPRAFQNRYRVILKRAGVEYVNFHALRHTFATNCVNLGFDAKALSEILGHSDVSVTLNTYVHPSVSVKKAYMDLLE